MVEARIFFYLALLVASWLSTSRAQGTLTCAQLVCPDISTGTCDAQEMTVTCTAAQACATITAQVAATGLTGRAKGCLVRTDCPSSRCLQAAGPLLGNVALATCVHECCFTTRCNSVNPPPTGKNELISILEANIAYLRGILTSTLPDLRNRIQQKHPLCSVASQIQSVTAILTALLNAKIAALARLRSLSRDSPETTELAMKVKLDVAQQDPRFYGYRPYVITVTYPPFGRDELINILNGVIETEQTFVLRINILLLTPPRDDIAGIATGIRTQIQNTIAALRRTVTTLRALPNCHVTTKHRGYGYGCGRYGNLYPGYRVGDTARATLLEKLDVKEV